MKSLNPLKLKYADFYWNVADCAQLKSVATRHQVGGVLVTTSGVLLPGWNGTVAGTDNCCETGPEVPGENRRKTGPMTLHAENNILGKAARQGISVEGAHLYITRAPCEACCRLILPTGIAAVFYGENHDDGGLDMLLQAGIQVCSRYDQMKMFNLQYPPEAHPEQLSWQ